MSKKVPPKFELKIDIQCGTCETLMHVTGGFPKYCSCCGGGLERYCLTCQKRADMFFEEWWPQEDQCLRTYSPAKRCSRCNAVLETPTAEHGQGKVYPN